MNMGTFEAMDQMEMMEVNGGARSRSARRAAQRAARANFTRAEVKRTGHMLVGYVGILTGVGGLATASGAFGAKLAASSIVGGVVGVGSEL